MGAPHASIPAHAKRLDAGIYSTPDGTLHLDLVELCIARGVSPTVKNQRRLREAAEQVARENEVPVETKAR